MSTARESLGPYEILGELGSGGMSRVLAAIDRRTGQRRAIKQPLLPTAALKARFLREASLQRRVDHPNVLPLLDVLEDNGAPSLVLPWVDGPSLAALCAAEPLQRHDALALFRQVVEGLAALHAAGLVHRDLKPHNVLLETLGGRVVARVADFGLGRSLTAQDAETLTATGAVLGTPAYQAPEQRKGLPLDASADVWALGVLLHELLTGHRPPPLLPLEGDWGALLHELLREHGRPKDAGDVLLRLPPTGETSEALAERCRALAPVPGKNRTPASAEPLPSIACHLPAEPDRFVGRSQELRAVAGLLSGGARLLTMVGLGGTGKTRLATQYARLWLDDWPGGVWFCSLAEARDLDGLVGAVARTFDVPLGRADPVVQLGHALAARGRCLVVLDNFEQVAGHAASTVGRWLARAERACFVVTSRAALGLAEEQTYEVPPLAQEEAIALFVQRAEARGRGALGGSEQQAITELVALLEGLPLAIELCAARVALMPPSQMLSRMGERFKLLGGGSARVPRQRTLRAALDWSWELLSPQERAALAQVSVFEGGFTLQAAEAVLELAETAASTLLQALVRHSLVRQRDERFDLLVSVKEYAQQALSEEERGRAEIRHGHFYAHLGAKNERDVDSGGDALFCELENLVAASRRAVARADEQVVADTTLAAWMLLSRQGPFQLGIDLLEKAALHTKIRRTQLLLGAASARRFCGQLQEAEAHIESARRWVQESGDPSERYILGMQANLLTLRGDLQEAKLFLERALELHRQAQDTHECITLANIGALAHKAGEFEEARVKYSEALSLARARQSQRMEGVLLSNLAGLHKDQGRLIEALFHYESSLRIALDIGDRLREATVYSGLASIRGNQGYAEEAVVYYERALKIFRELGDRTEEGATLGNLGVTHAAAGRLEEAMACYDAALRIHREVGARQSEARDINNLGDLLLKLNRWDEAHTCFESSLTLRRTLGDHQEAGALCGLALVHLHQRCLEQARADVEEAQLAARGKPLQQGFVLTIRAIVEHEAGDSDAAHRALVEAEQTAEQLGVGPDSELAREIAKVRAQLGSEL